jgi:hypothetical protein
MTTTLAARAAVETPPRPALEPAVSAPPVLTSENPDVAAAEERRWLRMLVTPFVLGACFFAGVIATGQLWLMGPAMLCAVAAIIFSFIFLGLTSDTNTDL